MNKEFEVGFNAKYIEQVLDHLEDDTVVLKVRGSDRPIEIRENDYLHVIMPKRVGS
jgi:DNA polymerase III sliding clamp (beta) subunit (PCNA family)